MPPVRDLPISSSHRDLLIGLQAAREVSKVVIIGASALAYHVPLRRPTADVDLVVVANAETTTELMRSLGWKPDRAQEQRWRKEGNDNEIVDILPGTPEAIAVGYVMLANGARRLSTVGFDLALRRAHAVSIGNTAPVPVPSLASLVLLKMVAWLDRPADRGRDLDDLGSILEQAIDDFDDRRFEHPLVEISDEERAAWFVGARVAEEIEEHHRKVIFEFLDTIASKRLEGLFGAGGARGYRNLEDLIRRRLSAFRRALG